jgi:hypothetical protein
MFYNAFRSTKSAMKEAEQNKLNRMRNINPKERLMNLQKRNKLKDLLITKFIDKYGLKYQDQTLENEVTKFVQKEKLNDVDLQRLDNRIRRMLRNNSARNVLKSTLTRNLQQTKQNELNEYQNNIISNTQNEFANKTMDLNLNNNNNTFNNTFNNTLYQDQNQNQKNEGISLPQVNNEKKMVHSQSTSNINPNYTYTKFPKRLYYNNKIYKSPEEELAELEKELAKDEGEYKPKCVRLDFTKEGDEWTAISKYNKKLFDQQILEERIKDNQMKRRTKEDLDNQIKQKIKKEYEEELKEKEYDKLLEEHLKKIDEIERKKLEDIRKQKLREKENRDALLKEGNIRKRIETLKEKKFERELVKNIKENIEKDKRIALERKIKENQALNKAIRENEIKKEKLKQKMKKEKEDDIIFMEENIKTGEKQDLERKYYFDRIKNYGNKYSLKKAEEILEQMKDAQKKEDEKIQFYYDEKRKAADEKERKEYIRKRMERKELKKYLDMQIEEKKKEEDFLKALDYEQARIWNVDCKKYMEDEKIIDGKIKTMNKINQDSLIKQINENSKKKKMKRNMSDAEYYMNRDLLEKAKASLANE